jgi:hypothetical protein
MKQTIILQTSDIQAILAGSKNMFREEIKPQPTGEDIRILSEAYDWIVGNNGSVHCLTAGDHGWEITKVKAPYVAGFSYRGNGLELEYEPGQCIAVQEIWTQECEPFTDDFGVGLRSTGKFVYKADGYELPKKSSSLIYSKWKSASTMPREAVRLYLEITDIRAERLNEISNNAVRREGIELHIPVPGDGGPLPKLQFKRHWESRHGKGSFDDRWVWVYGFKLIQK